MLKEVLDRIELPPDDEIPDAAAVDELGISRWTIPHTEITLVRDPRRRTRRASGCSRPEPSPGPRSTTTGSDICPTSRVEPAGTSKSCGRVPSHLC